MHPVSLSRFKAQAREAGAAALMPKRLGPKGPSKLTAQLEKQIRELAGQELYGVGEDGQLSTLELLDLARDVVAINENDDVRLGTCVGGTRREREQGADSGCTIADLIVVRVF